MRIIFGTVLVAAIFSAAVAVSADAPQRQRRQGSVTAADSEAIARRLYKGILGREADPDGLRSNASAIRRGELQNVIDGLLGSDEFRDVEGGKSPRQLLDQFYRGLLGRASDPSGAQAFMPRVRNREYAGVVTEMVESQEFRDNLGGSGSSGASGSSAATAPPPMSALEAALACQGRVIEAVRRDAGGRIFLTFDRLPDVSADGRTVSGPGVDRFENKDRQMTYRCAGTDVTYSYADRRPPQAYDKLQFPSGAVRNCQQAVQAGLLFDAASLSASDTNAEYVLGLAGGRIHQCTMDRARVVSVK
jgi:hypothetical protein